MASRGEIQTPHLNAHPVERGEEVKLAFVNGPGRRQAGLVIIADIGSAPTQILFQNARYFYGLQEVGNLLPSQW